MAESEGLLSGFNWTRLEQVAHVSFTEGQRARIMRGVRVAFQPERPKAEHFARIAEIAAELDDLIAKEAEWPVGYGDDLRDFRRGPLRVLRRVAEEQALSMSLRFPSPGRGRPTKTQRDKAFKRHVVPAWREAWHEAGGTGRGYYSGGERGVPGGPLLEFIVELTKQAGQPMTRNAVYDMLRDRG